jgi:hypothetical protein
MDAERLPDGRIRVPARAEGPDGLIGDGMVVIDESSPLYRTWSDYLDAVEASKRSQ